VMTWGFSPLCLVTYYHVIHTLFVPSFGGAHPRFCDLLLTYVCIIFLFPLARLGY